jgi:uncharacterized protein YndB with AHSA1/START domain
MPAIKHYLVIQAPAAKVYDAVTSQAGLSSWWTRETKAQPRVGGINEFKFGDRFFNRMEVAELEPGKRVAWKCVEAEPEWVGTTLTFDLEEENGVTTVRFGHNDWAAETDFFASCNYNWGLYMKSLKQYVETGKGMPFGD